MSQEKTSWWTAAGQRGELLKNMQIDLLNILLISTLVIALPIIQWMRGSALRDMNPTEARVIKNWLIFMIAILFLRAVVGTIFMVGGVSHWSIQKFYPIRIAYPNYGILGGLPYVVIGFIILAYLPSICHFISSNRSRYVLLWAFSVVLSITFGGIHGGIITGNIGVSGALDHIHDASLNRTIAETFSTHTDRITGHLEPGYKAPHTLSHPAGSLAYWQFMTHATSPIVFSLINVFILSLAFTVMYWALRRHYPDKDASQVIIGCMVTPAILIYGRSDDAVYYAFAAVIMALSYISIMERRYMLTLGIGVLLAVAINISYAALIMVPALLTFTTNERLNKLWTHIRLVTPHALIIAVVVIFMTSVTRKYLGYSYLDAFLASVDHNSGSNIVHMLGNGYYWVILNDRIMTICDFLLFGGPLFLYLFYRLCKGADWKIVGWRIRNIALSVLMLVLIVNSNGPGEVSRPWGSIYLVVGIIWFAELLKHEEESTRWWIIRSQLLWGLTLQTILNFGW